MCRGVGIVDCNSDQGSVTSKQVAVRTDTHGVSMPPSCTASRLVIVLPAQLRIHRVQASLKASHRCEKVCMHESMKDASAYPVSC